MLDKLPPLSPTLNKLLATLSRDDASFAKIADLIEKDAVLAGNILGLVNSALYARSGRVNSVRYAVSLLGVSKLRNAALNMSVSRMWNRMKTPPGFSIKAFNQHAIGVAILADLISQECSLDYPEGAFVGGLLHDIGKMLIATGQPEKYDEITLLSAEQVKPEYECEIDVLGYSHADLSAEALNVWNLPVQIQAAVRYHHKPYQDPWDSQSSSMPLSYALAAADEYVNQMGFGLTRPALLQRINPDPLHVLGIEAQLARILDQFHPEFEAARSFV